MTGTLAVAVLVLLGTSLCTAEVCHIADPIQRQECSSVSMMHGTATQVHNSVLKQLCEAGHRHVMLKGATPSQYASLPPTSPRRAEQFAIMYIHRDDFSDKVIWKSGEATDIMCDDNWFVDEEVKLTNGYHWYTHGLPLWPMLNQTLAKKKQSIFSRKKKLDWPNYAIATPFYLVPSEIYNSRDPNLAIQKLFAGDFLQTALSNQQDTFANPNGFKEAVTNLHRVLFLDQLGYARKDISSDFDAYPNWLQPLVQTSLRPMLESFLASQTPKKGQEAICPDELYVFFHKPPCSSSTSCLVLNEFQLNLKLSSCPDTSIVVGYGGNRDGVAEEIVSTKVLGKSESVPSSRVGLESVPSSRVEPKKSSATCNNCNFHIVGYLLVLLTFRMTSFHFGI